MPLKYSFKAFVEKDYVMSLSDLKSERDVLKFAASEFKRHGQPLDSFAQLFTLESEPAKRVAKKFVREYRRRIPTGNYDAALAEFAENNELALLGYTAPKASEQARAGVFMESDDVRVLKVMLALPGFSHAQLGTKLGEAIGKNNVAIVNLLLLKWVRGEGKLKVSAWSQVFKVIVPEEWMLAASRGPFLDILRQLLPYSGQSQVDKCLVEAASLGHTEVAVLLAKSPKIKVSDAVTKAIEQRHFELANELVRLYPSKHLIENAFYESAEHGNASLIREFINNVDMNGINSAIIGAAQREKFEIVDMLFEHASADAIERIAPMVLGKEAARSVFEKVLRYMPQLASKLLNGALEVADYDAVQKLLPFTTLDDIQEAFSNACNDGNFKTVSLFTPFTRAKTADPCFRELAGQEGTPPELLEQLLPHVSRDVVFSIHSALGKWPYLKESTRAAIGQRVEGFPREIAFVHSFRAGYWSLNVNKEFAIRDAIREGEKYKVTLPTMCTDFESCTRELEVLTKTQLSNAAVEEAMTDIRIVFNDEALIQVVPFLAPLATPFVCTSLMESSRGVLALVPAIACACGEKALKNAVTQQLVHAVYNEPHEPLKTLIFFASPQQLLTGLRAAIFRKKTKAFEMILKALRTSQADDILRSVVFSKSGLDDRDVELLEKGLLQKASKPAIDASLLHLSRRRSYDKKSVMMLSKHASEKGKATAEQLTKWLRENQFA